MPKDRRLLTIVETPEFLRRAAEIGMTTRERATLIDTLARDPTAGVALGGGLRKLRVARTGGGKSGGYRVLHFYRSEATPLFLLTVFAKNERANITPAEKSALIEICDEIAATYGRR
ncbi:MAG: hypothetical protein Tsb0010_10100 [Parvularculaceae bacterium]